VEMQNLIVLGLVPGTHLQITFLIWIVMAILIGLFVAVWFVRRVHVIRNYIVGTRMISITRHRRLI
jgi:hypothetical protein